MSYPGGVLPGGVPVFNAENTAYVEQAAERQRREEPETYLDDPEAHVGRNRIEIAEWRVIGEDEDCLSLHVFGAGDKTEQLALIAAEQKGNYDGEGIVWGDDDAEHCGTIVNEMVIFDGQTLTSHDGRKFRVSIAEVTDGQ